MKPAVQRGTSLDIVLDEQISEDAPGSFLDVILGSLRAKDHYTFQHCGSVRAFALALGRSVGLRSLNMWRLSEAAFLHDIGKLCIPAEILQKAGPLTPTEKRVMDRHPELGQRLLEHVPGYEEVAHIVRGCHENFDGSGYPDGLAGDEIPIEARIIGVVDAYDAMTSHRPYKPPVPGAVARGEIAARAGTRFDPKIATAFLAVFVEDEEEAV